MVTNTSEPEAKIALFRSLFRGREDVYAVRFESRKSGRSGYAPACANEWVRGLCEKPRIKRAACLNRKLLPVTDEVIRHHLSGMDKRGRPFVIGVCRTCGRPHTAIGTAEAVAFDGYVPLTRRTVASSDQFHRCEILNPTLDTLRITTVLKVNLDDLIRCAREAALSCN